MSARVVDTTVTYLAMPNAPRMLPPKPSSPALALMKAERIPLHYYRYLYGAVGGSWLWFERLMLDDAALAAKVHRPSVEVFVLYAEGAPAGYYELDFGAEDATNLNYFGLMPEWMGRKIGPWLLGSAISEAFLRGSKSLTVNTCTMDHPAALPLYQRLGFRPVARENRRISVPAQFHIPEHVLARKTP